MAGVVWVYDNDPFWMFLELFKQCQFGRRGADREYAEFAMPRTEITNLSGLRMTQGPPAVV